jgi:hypothetical protein
LSNWDLDNEIGNSKAELENRLGVEIKTFVPPFGRVNNRILDIIANFGYRIVCVNIPTNLSHKNLHIVVRRSIHRYDTVKSFQRKVQRGWESYFNLIGWRFAAFCSGGTILAQRLFGIKNIS